jgi:hypothetical protein
VVREAGRNQSSGRKKEDEMSNREYDNSVWEGNREARGRDDRGRHGNERGWFDRAGDEVSSWFGDEDAERRRRADERDERWRDRYDYDNGSDYRHNYGRYGHNSDRVRRDLDRESYDRRESYGRGLYGGSDARRGGDSGWHDQRPLTDRDRSGEGEYERGRGDRGMGWGDERYRGDMRNDMRGRDEARGWSDTRREWNGDRDRSRESFREGGRSWNDDSDRGGYRDRNWNGNTAYRGYRGDFQGNPRNHERYGGDYERYDRSSYAGLSNEDRSRDYDAREYSTGRHDRSWRG